MIKTGPGYEVQGDPMKPLEAELAKYRYVQIPQVQTFTGMSDPPIEMGSDEELNLALSIRWSDWIRDI